MSEFTSQDQVFMRRAIILAQNGEGRVSPNPPVGCVLVKDGRIIAEGWHDRLGGRHAEAMALANAGGDARGAPAYVTLSPCSSHGRQPPCTDALIHAGVAGVMVACPDPNPKNADGLGVLNRAGIPARAGLLADEAAYLARGFMKKQRAGLPWLTLKYAMTLDGRIAAASGDSKWISGPASREAVQDMRSRSDAVLVGSGTVLADDPRLDVRDPVLAARGGADAHRQPLRVVVDGRCRLPATARMLSPGGAPGGRAVVYCLAGTEEGRVAALRARGAEVTALASATGRVPLRAMLADLGGRGVDVVLCEGGGGLAAALIAEGLVDEVAVFIAPKIVGGAAAPGPVGGEGAARMADALPIAVREWKTVGPDILVRGYFEKAPPGDGAHLF